VGKFGGSNEVKLRKAIEDDGVVGTFWQSTAEICGSCEVM